MGFYAATSFHHLTGFEPPVWLVAALDAMQVCAVASGILAWWRPSFVAIPGIYVLVSKDWTEWLLGLPMLTRTDYLPVSEICIFLAVGIAARLHDPDRERLILARARRDHRSVRRLAEIGRAHV